MILEIDHGELNDANTLWKSDFCLHLGGPEELSVFCFHKTGFKLCLEPFKKVTWCCMFMLYDLAFSSGVLQAAAQLPVPLALVEGISRAARGTHSLK